jgi:predicted GIY-YIG superfamily endonuclease
MRNNWTFENCEERAQKYKRKIDFLKNDRLVYNAAYKKKWLIKICNHMEISGDKFNRCIYSYEFSDKTVYIGLTSNFNIRNIQHFNKSNKNNSVVKQYYNQIGILTVHKQLTDYIDYSDASKLEGEYLNLYKKDGWKILNKSKTGSLGASNLIYTKEKCKEI